MARILLVAPHHNGEKNFRPGGQVTAASGLCEQLRQFGHRVDVINVVPVNFTTASRTSKIWSVIKRMAKAWEMLHRGRYDFALLFTGSLFNLPERLMIVIFSRMRGVKTALFFRNSNVLGISPSSIRGCILQRLLTVPHILLVQGKRWRDQFVKMGLPSNRIAVIPNWLPVDITVRDAAKNFQSGEKLCFAFVARLIKEKGIFELVEAAAILAKRFDFEIQIVGDGDAFNSLKQHNLECVKFLGWQHSDGIREVLENSHVFVLPSYQEGFPNAVLEAMAYGQAIIATDVGAIGESVQDEINGFLVTPRSVSDLVRVMTRYLENPCLVSKHSRESLRIVHERHDRTRNCQQIVDLLSGEKA